MLENHHFQIFSIPIVSMYAIYGNIYHEYTPNVSIYTIHGYYGIGKSTNSMFHVPSRHVHWGNVTPPPKWPVPPSGNAGRPGRRCPQHLWTGGSPNGYRKWEYHGYLSMDWFKGKFTGNTHIQWGNP